ncbi:MAG: hypothetical protein IPH52_06555 [Leptospiraceae bacterium]|nr:hypothetical protein [Leptospiraceae bacterium]
MNIPYYPRVYQSFVKELNKDIKQGNSIDNKIIIQVYNRVAQDYLDSLKHELKFLLEFAEKESENEKQIKKFIESFQDERTPFERMKLIIAINKKMGGDVRFREKVSKAFDSMKNMGIFEETNNNKWRVGRLVKAAFKMTYDR